VLVNLLFGAAERPRALKHFMLILFGLSAAAPVLAAALVDGPGWRWIFLAALPLAALALAGCWHLLPDAVGRGGAPVRWAAGPLLLGAAALTLLQLALSQARYDLFADPLRLAGIALAGLALLAGFLVHQWRHHDPHLRLRELRHPVYATGLLLYFLHYLLSNASAYLFPIYAERSLGLPLVTAGWLSTFAAVVSFAGAYAYLKLARKLPSKKPVMAAGALLAALAAWLFSCMPPDVPPQALLAPLVAKGLFGVLLVLPVAGMTFRDLGDERFAPGYQGKNLMRQLAGSFSGALAAIALQDRQFADASRVAALAGPGRAPATDWLDAVQAGFEAQGLAPAQAHGAALAALERAVEQQAQLLACEDVYRMIALAALLATAVVLVQRRLK
jgi:predicted MFS family arabinose efflux permease